MEAGGILMGIKKKEKKEKKGIKGD